MREIQLGAVMQKQTTVIPEMLASRVGSGSLDVFATPMMCALMEHAASACLQQFLDEDETSVGIMLSITHDAPTPAGMDVTASAKIQAVNGREVAFVVEAFDANGPIGSGAHKRFIVNSKKFQEKANAKASGVQKTDAQ